VFDQGLVDLCVCVCVCVCERERERERERESIRKEAHTNTLTYLLIEVICWNEEERELAFSLLISPHTFSVRVSYLGVGFRIRIRARY
jgi:hypothetical protein